MRKNLLSLFAICLFASVTAQEDVTSNLVFHLTGDETIGTAVDTTVPGGASLPASGTVTGTITHTDGADGTPSGAFNIADGSVINFNSGDIPNLPINGIDPVNADGSAPRTISAWVKTSNTGNQDFLTYGTTSNGQHIHCELRNGDFRFGHWNIDFNFSGLSANDGNWHHIVAVLFDNAGVLTASLFFDGVKQTDVTYTGGVALATNITANTVFSVGQRNNGNDQFIGDLDEIRIYNRSLTDAQVLQLFTDNGGVLSTSKVDGLANFSAYVESGILKIKSDVKIDEVEVYNLTGAKVKVFSNDDAKDVSSLSTGLYILKVKAENVEQSVKLLIK